MSDEFVQRCVNLGSKCPMVPFGKQEVMYRFKRYQSRLRKLRRLEQQQRQQQLEEEEEALRLSSSASWR